MFCAHFWYGDKIKLVYLNDIIYTSIYKHDALYIKETFQGKIYEIFLF